MKEEIVTSSERSSSISSEHIFEEEQIYPSMKLFAKYALFVPKNPTIINIFAYICNIHI